MCGTALFAQLTQQTCASLLSKLSRRQRLMQTSSGVPMPTPKGEQIIGHYSPYTVFTSGEGPLVVTAGASLETDLHPRVRTPRKFGLVPLTCFPCLCSYCG